MLERVPAALLAALTPEEREGLMRVLGHLGQELANLYADEAADHREARGDNGQLFGMKIWTHGWFRYEELFAEDPLVEVVSENGSWALHIGRLRIGVYRQGSDVDDDIHQDIPHADSETKRSYGVNNASQLALFDGDLGRPTLDDASIAKLLNVTVTHFGNSRDGLVKWYVGAQSRPGRWGWVYRQPHAEPRRDDGDGVIPIRPLNPRLPGDVVPFDQRPVKDIDVTPHVWPARDRPPEDRE